MVIGNYAELASVIIAFAALIYTYSSYTKKYELKSQYRKEILSWYTEILDILIRLKLEAKAGFKDEAIRRELLSKLSARIDVGRFYFPNIKQQNQYGNHKPLAYQGLRNVVLDFLIFSYDIFDNSDSKKHLSHAEILQRQFTSAIYEVLDPISFEQETHKFTKKKFNKNLSFEEFISMTPDAFENYIKKDLDTNN